MWRITGSQNKSDDSESDDVFFEYDEGDDDEYHEDKRIFEGEEEIVTLEDRVRKMVELKGKRLLGDEARWRESVRQQMELELNKRVREALETPPLESVNNNPQDLQRESPDINAHLFQGRGNRRFPKITRWGPEQDFKLSHNEDVALGQGSTDQQGDLYHSNPELRSTHLRQGRWSEGATCVHDCYSRFPDLQPKVRRFYTKDGYVTSLRSGDYPAGVEMVLNGEVFVDKNGVVRDTHGPFWPADYLPMYATPRFKWWIHVTSEPLDNFRSGE